MPERPVPPSSRLAGPARSLDSSRGTGQPGSRKASGGAPFGPLREVLPTACNASPRLDVPGWTFPKGHAVSASTRRHLAAVLLALATSTAVSAAPLVLAGPASADTTSAAVVVGPVTFRPTVLGTTAAQPANSLRGQYRWMGYGSQVTGWPTPDLYYRDQVYWGKLERQQGVYDFSVIEAGLKNAAAVGGKFGFRVFAYCPGCWMEKRTDHASFPPVTPPYLPAVAGSGSWYDPDGVDGPVAGWQISRVPDWNSEAFLSRWEALVTELGRRYGDDPRLGYVDVGGYGKFGEWWVEKADLHITDANGLRMVKAVASAFPTKHVMFPTMQTVAFTMAAVNANPNLGIRTDSLGCSGMNSMVTAPPDNGKTVNPLAEVWRTRPFFSEWCTQGDPVAGAAQVTQWHVSTTSSENMKLKYAAMTPAQQSAFLTATSDAGYRYAVTRLSVGAVRPGRMLSVALTLQNAGSAPTYDPWTVQLRLTDAAGHLAAALPLTVDLRKVLPGSATYLRTVTAPAGLPTGAYTASIAVVDPSGYLSPMALANTSRLTDGSYRLGRVGAAPAGPTTSRRG